MRNNIFKIMGLVILVTLIGGAIFLSKCIFLTDKAFSDALEEYIGEERKIVYPTERKKIEKIKSLRLESVKDLELLKYFPNLEEVYIVQLEYLRLSPEEFSGKLKNVEKLGELKN